MRWEQELAKLFYASGWTTHRLRFTETVMGWEPA